MGEKEPSPAVFGAFDGMTSVIGVIVALLSASPSSVVKAVIGLAVASAVGMAAGEYLGDPDRSLRNAAVMGGATLVGTLLPAIPFFLTSGHVAQVLGGLIAVGMCAVIAAYRSHFESTVRSWVETFSIFFAVVAAVLLASALTGAGA